MNEWEGAYHSANEGFIHQIGRSLQHHFEDMEITWHTVFQLSYDVWKYFFIDWNISRNDGLPFNFVQMFILVGFKWLVMSLCLVFSNSVGLVLFRVMSYCGSPVTLPCLPAMLSTRSWGSVVCPRTSSSFYQLMAQCSETPSPPLSTWQPSTSPAVSRKEISLVWAVHPVKPLTSCYSSVFQMWVLG